MLFGNRRLGLFTCYFNLIAISSAVKAMNRSLFVLMAFLMTCTAFAAPAPDPFRSGWGTPVDPNRDCKISRDGGVLTIEMPGSVHDYDPIRERFNAPRILRDIEGDFEIKVRIRIECRPSVSSTVNDQPSFISAGFLLIYPVTSRCVCSRMEYIVSRTGNKPKSSAVKQVLAEPRKEHSAPKGIGAEDSAVLKDWACKVQPPTMTWDRSLQERQDIIWDRDWQNWPLPKKVDYVYLRLEHRGSYFFFFISPDGEKWTQLVWISGPPEKLNLGLAAFSTSAEPSKVRFDQLWLSCGKRNKR
jgi:hypothetical protein